MMVQIGNWKYYDGYNHATFELLKEPVPSIVGWHCWAHPSNAVEFEQWMKQFCSNTSYVVCSDHNRPIYLLHITDPAEASHFLLKWQT